MNTVISKYKNPDRFIARLKREAEWLQENLEDTQRFLDNQRGDHWFTYVGGVTNSVSLNHSDNKQKAQQARIGQRVKLMGTITELKHCKHNGEYTAEFELDVVYLINK